MQRIAELRVSVSLSREAPETMSVPVKPLKPADMNDSISTSHATNASWVHEVDTHDLDESRAQAQIDTVPQTPCSTVSLRASRAASAR